MIEKLSRLLHFFFPSLCLHCHTPLKNGQLICKGCSSNFELIDPTASCYFCFADTSGICKNCLGKKNPERLAAACDLFGGVKTLVTLLKNGQTPYLAKTAASFMTLQLSRLDWPYFDLLIPIPKRLWTKRKNHAELIAQSLQNILKIESKNCLTCDSGFLRREQSDFHEEKNFYVKKVRYLKGKTILLIDDVMKTGKTLKSAAHALREAGCRVYGLTFARDNFSMGAKKPFNQSKQKEWKKCAHVHSSAHLHPHTSILP